MHRYLVARRDLNIAVGVGERRAGGERQRVEECRVDIGVACVDREPLSLEIDFRLDALPPRLADVLEIAEARLERAGDIENVVLVVGVIDAELPAERADVGAIVVRTAQARFERAGDRPA